MNSARQIMYDGASGSAKPPFDWSYASAISFGASSVASMQKFTAMPTLVYSTPASTVNVLTDEFPLWSRPGCLAVFERENSSSGNVLYKIFDTSTQTLSSAVATIALGSTSDVDFRAVATRDGRIMMHGRYQGKTWIMNEDGTGFEYIGQTNPSWGTSHGLRLYANYDDTFTVFSDDVTNGASYNISLSGTITSGASMNTTYPYTFIKIPGYVAVTGSTGVLSVWNENMSSKLVNNRSVASYACMANKLMIPPGVENEVTWGGDVRSATIGVKMNSSFTNVTTATDFVASGRNGCSRQVFLPNGQIFAFFYDTSPRRWALYNYNADSVLFFDATGEGRITKILLLPTGKIYVRVDNNSVRLYDFGIKPSFCPINMCNGPFGFNGCKGI